MDFLAKWKFPLFVSILLSAFYLHSFENRAFVELDIEVSQRTWFKIYWAEPGKLFSEKKMSRVRVKPDQEHHRFFLTNLKKVEKLRIDPHQYEGSSVVKKLVITQNGIETLRFESADDFGRLEPLFGVSSSEMEGDGFHVTSSGVDPNFEFNANLSQGSFAYLSVFLKILTIFVCVFFFFFFSDFVRDDARFVPFLFAAVFILIIVMASISKPDVHPDEYVHFSASEYYKTHWLPPVVEDPAIRNTYSVYGVSRLNKPEVSYFFTGKFAQLLSSFKLVEYQNLRMLNVVLFGIILLLVLRYYQAQLLAVPLLLSPQLWYVFSYCNSDAFSLFIAFLAGFQVVLPDSSLNSFLTGQKQRGWIARILLIGLLFSMLILMKKNYYFFILFLLGYVVWKLVFDEFLLNRIEYVKRLAFVVIIALSFAGLRVGADYVVNGLDRAEKISRLRSELAEPIYNPDTPLEKKHFSLYRKSRGATLEEIVIVDSWFEKTFRSAYGLYGYFTVSASDGYYNVVRWVSVFFLAFVVLSILVRAHISEKILLFFLLSCATGLIGVSIWHSWTADYQTQGRYLFPIIPMLGMLLYHTRRYMPDAGFRLFLFAMFLISLYSFIYIALMDIPKIALNYSLLLPIA